MTADDHELTQLELILLEIETLWETDAAGRLVRARTPNRRPAPLCVVAAIDSGVVVATRHDVSDERDTAVRDLVDRSRHEAAAVGWQPSCADEIEALLATDHLVGEVRCGPSFTIGAPIEADPQLDLRANETGIPPSLWSTMPKEDRSLTEPWVVAVVGDAIAAVCETARSGDRAVEAGVWTYPPYRRCGLAVNVVAAWTRLAQGRTVFYSTDPDNVASQATVRRVGGAPLAQLWQLHEADTSP